ncbi:hypothetical protein CDG81_04585 [Actinopolyspora erythraea]|uniref:DUF2269 domain-containing protein n=1 Tax=Actinopolyspora erythraea TaxID=414996 RepID=A0A223RPA5_9ACTN|nr:hypothetical protein [Actinopolyspora erythraea]ASU77708.1 hypothetical protein CDG81_04585 [Actinopolyspora erythraea]
MADRRSRSSRDLLVWMHVLTSVGWMSQALALATLLAFGLSTGDPEQRLSAVTMAEVLDEHLLLHMANASAFTGLMLSALTPWGYFRHWWVLTKFAITTVQVYAGIFVLGPNLQAGVRAAEDGRALPPGVAVGALLMASAMAFQTWASVAKPWGRTPWTRSPRAPRKVPSGPGWLFLVATLLPVAEYALSVGVLGFPFPFGSLLVALVHPIARSRGLRSGPAPRVAARGDAGPTSVS